MQIINSF